MLYIEGNTMFFHFWRKKNFYFINNIMSILSFWNPSIPFYDFLLVNLLNYLQKNYVEHLSLNYQPCIP